MAEEKINEWIEEFRGFNKEIEERILEANNDETKLKWSKLLPDLMSSEIFMAGQLMENEDPNSDEKRMNVLVIQKDGHAIVPFFTSPERMTVLVGPEKNQFDVMKISIVRFFESVAGRPTVLNPLSPYIRLFSPFEMKILAAENAEKAPQTSGESKN